ncbi:MAG: hypothetical protein GX424_03520 [Clostridiales bacterium]|jgi:hypothetical protein|nr:hypothetical protein [Clostridiales bacterium]
MPETIAAVLISLLAIAGAVDLVRYTAHWLLKNKRSGKLFIFVPVQGHEESAEWMLGSALEKLEWIPENDKKVVCVDCGMDEETATVCRIIAARNPAVEICTPSELGEMLERQVYNT